MDLLGNVIRVVDGDTAWVAIKVRLSNGNAPELPTADGVLAKRRFRAWLKTHGDDVRLHYSGIDPYGRLLSTLRAVSDGDIFVVEP
jgi:endonuclease YncB( thermonuclease family)